MAPVRGGAMHPGRDPLLGRGELAVQDRLHGAGGPALAHAHVAGGDERVARGPAATGWPSAAYTAWRWRRNSRSNSRSFSDERSSPYHQHQSLAQAARNDSQALSSASSGRSAALAVRGGRARPARRSSRSQARRSSACPIQTEKSAWIQLPAKTRGISRGAEAASAFAHGHRLQAGSDCDAAVDLAQEDPAAVAEVLPRVLAVQHDAHERLAVQPGVPPALPDPAEAVQEVGGRARRVHARVGEADEVGERAVAEEQGDVAGGGAPHPGTVQEVERVGGAAAVAVQRTLDAALEDGLVGRGPAHAGPRHLQHRRLGHRALPTATRPRDAGRRADWWRSSARRIWSAASSG